MRRRMAGEVLRVRETSPDEAETSFRELDDVFLQVYICLVLGFLILVVVSCDSIVRCTWSVIDVLYLLIWLVFAKRMDLNHEFFELKLELNQVGEILIDKEVMMKLLWCEWRLLAFVVWVMDQFDLCSSNLLDYFSVHLQTQTRIWLGEVLHERFDEEMAVADLLADGELLWATLHMQSFFFIVFVCLFDVLPKQAAKMIQEFFFVFLKCCSYRHL